MVDKTQKKLYLNKFELGFHLLKIRFRYFIKLLLSFTNRILH